jgi:Family of unknown function (DUF6049)
LQAVVGSSSALPVTSGFTGQAPRRTASGLTLLAWDDELSRLTTQLTTPAQGAVTAQRFLAETATLLGERSGVARSFLVAMPRTVDPDVAALRQLLTTLSQTPWVQFVTTGDLQQSAATQDPVASTSKGNWDLGGGPQLDATRLARIADERKAADEIATVLGPDGQSFGERWKSALDQLTSVRWRSDAGQLARLEASVNAAAAAATNGISVADQTTNFLADEGTLQIVVVNDLSVPVEGVRLVLAPANPRLRIIAQPDAVDIGAKSRAVVAVRAEALAAGLVPVDATGHRSDCRARSPCAPIHPATRSTSSAARCCCSSWSSASSARSGGRGPHRRHPPLRPRNRTMCPHRRIRRSRRTRPTPRRMTTTIRREPPREWTA